MVQENVSKSGNSSGVVGEELKRDRVRKFIDESDKIHEELASIRDEVRMLLDANETLPPEERLALEEFELDTAEEGLIVAEAEEDQNILQTKLTAVSDERYSWAARMNKIFFQDFDIKGILIRGFYYDREVSNYPIRPRPFQEVQELRNKIKLGRYLSHIESLEDSLDATAAEAVKSIQFAQLRQTASQYTATTALRQFLKDEQKVPTTRSEMSLELPLDILRGMDVSKSENLSKYEGTLREDDAEENARDRLKSTQNLEENVSKSKLKSETELSESQEQSLEGSKVDFSSFEGGGVAKAKKHDAKSVVKKSEMDEIAIEEMSIRNEMIKMNESMSPEDLERFKFIQKLFAGNWIHEYLPEGALPSTLDQLEIYTRQQIHMQLVFIREGIRRVKRWFNWKFDDIKGAKKLEMDGIKRRNERCREITDYLGIQIEIADPNWHTAENTESVFDVLDNEVPVQKYFSEEEMNDMMRRLADEEARAKAKREGFRERALMIMMDGVLEKRKEDMLRTNVPKPEFMITKEEWEWSAEEYKAADEYRVQVHELDEKRTEYKKEIEAELRNIMKANATAKMNVDRKIRELFDLKIQIEMNIRLEELKSCRLLALLNIRKALEINEENLKERLKVLQHQMKESQRGCAESLTVYEGIVRRYERISATEKTFEKSFRRDLGEVGHFYEPLSKLYKKVPKLDFVQSNEPENVLQTYEILVKILTSPSESLNYYKSQDEKIHYLFMAITNSLKELDDQEREMPSANLSKHVWDRFCHLRREKLSYKYQSEILRIELTTMREKLASCRQSKDELTAEISKVVASLTQQRDTRVATVHDFEFQTVLPQGNIELENYEKWEDFFQAVMIPVSAVTDCNRTIRRIGKIGALNETKKYHTFIKQIEWRYKKANLSLYDAQENLKDIATQRVTKEVLHFLEHYENYRKNQDDRLEKIRKLFDMSGAYEDKLRQMLETVEQKVISRDRFNIKLGKSIENGNVELNETRLKCNVKERKDVELATKRRMGLFIQSGTLMRKIAKTCEQVLILETELDKLYKKTFPVL